MGITAFLSTQILDASASGVSVLTGTASQGRTALELGTMAQAATSSYLAIVGGTLTGQVVTAASVTGGAGLVLTPGDTPTTLTDGAIWSVDGSTAAYMRMEGTSYQFPFLNRVNTWFSGQAFGALYGTTAATLAVRNSTTAQLVGIFNTYTSTTNNECLLLGGKSTYHVIAGAVGSAGGTARPIHVGQINSSDTLSNALVIGTDCKTTITVHDQIGLSYSPAGSGTATLLLATAGSNVHTVNRPTSGNITIALSGDTNAQRFLILLTTSGSGTPGTVTWFSGITWLTNAGTAPTLATANSKTDSVVIQRSGSGTYFGWHTGVNA